MTGLSSRTSFSKVFYDAVSATRSGITAAFEGATGDRRLKKNGLEPHGDIIRTLGFGTTIGAGLSALAMHATGSPLAPALSLSGFAYLNAKSLYMTGKHESQTSAPKPAP